MDKSKYYIIGIILIVAFSIVYISQMNREVTEKIKGNISLEYKNITGSYKDGDNQTSTNNTDGGNKTPIKKLSIKIRGKIFAGGEPITKNSDSHWYVNVVFDSNTTEKMAEEIISKYDIPKPHYIKRGFSYPKYYINTSMSDFESIKNRLEEEEYSNLRLAKKIKITGENFTAAVWGVYDEILPGLRSSGIPLKETMVMDLVYGPETPQTESKNIMELLDSDEKIIGTTADIFY